MDYDTAANNTSVKFFRR